MKRLVPNLSIITLLISTILPLSAVCPTHVTVNVPPYTPVDPQIGENIWQIVSRTGTAVDEVEAIVASSAAGINDIISSSTLCCACDCFITAADVPGLVITQPGVYCVAQDITIANAGGANVISVQSNDVVIDFRGHSITAGNANAIVSVGVVSGVSIKNGILAGAGVYGVFALSTTGLVLDHCNIVNSAGVGVNCQGVNGLFINTCNATGGGGTFGYEFAGVVNGVVENSTAHASTGSGFGLGLASRNVTFVNCYADNNTLAGFISDNTSSNIAFYICRSNNNGTDGFFVDSTNSRIENCAAVGNTFNGFDINPSASATAHIELIGSLAFSNTLTGIRNGLVTLSYIFNNVSANNVVSNYTNVTAGTLVASTAVTTSTGYWSNING